MSARSAVPRAALAGLMALLLFAGGAGGAFPGTARADSAPLDPANPATPTTVTADPLPTVQINGVAWSQVVVGTTVYVAGQFTTARPAGAPAGTQEVPRNNLLAYDIRTGELVTTFAPDLNAQARTVAASPDGSRIYVGGDFTVADGQPRLRMAAYSTATGQLISDFRPAFDSRVMAIAATGTAVYVGGWFSAVGSTGRRSLAAISAANGALLSWAPVAEGGGTTPSRGVLALVLTDDGRQVVVGGRFGYLNGVAATGVGALDAATGATRPFAVNQRLTNQGANSAVYSLSTDGAHVYGTGYNFRGTGNLEGAFKATADGGRLQWVNDCRGDSYSNVPINGALYLATHAHDCSNIGSFPEQNPMVFNFGTAVSLAATGTVGARTLSNQNFAGQPAPAVLPWFPTFSPGTYTGQGQAGWSVTGTSEYVVYGGEFPRVNGTGQQGLVRFAMPQLAPNKVGPRASGSFAPTATMIPGAVRISWPASSDRDNENLTYRVYRDSDTTAPACEVVRRSTWWDLPTFACSDTRSTAGAHRYRVIASDPAGNTVSSTWVDATVPAGSSGSGRAYADAVLADGALDHWPLGEPSGSTAYDRAGTRDMSIASGVTRGRTGAIAGDTDTAFQFDGTSSGVIATRTAAPGPQTFSVEAWFQTTSTLGGRVVGFSNTTSGSSNQYDRHIYLDARGRIFFGVWPGEIRTVNTERSYNDGSWHHVVASLSPAGMSLYVDGALAASRADTTSAQAFTGYWRAGGGTTWAGAEYLNGRIDEVAVYPTALTGAQVARHRDLGRGVNLAPTAAFTAVASGLSVAVDASGSADADGRVASYGWDFGDGSTGTGATASHTFASAGTYTVTLTVTDDDGATGSTTRSVTVTPPPTGAGSVAADGFGREVSGGWGAAEVGGAWTIGGTAANASVTGGAGQLTGAAGRTMRAVLAGVSQQDVAVQADVALPEAATGGGTFVSLGAQQVGSSNYLGTLGVRADGSLFVRLDRAVNGVETTLGAAQLALRHVPGAAVTVRLETSGAGTGTTTLKVKAWPAGAAEPAQWTLTRTDSTAELQRPGGLLVETYTSGSATRPSIVRLDNLRAEPASATPPAP